MLQDVTFHVQAGERVGVGTNLSQSTYKFNNVGLEVGRTGAGKSSLTLALLRCIYTEGQVTYDRIPTQDISLDALRSNITIIPQMVNLSLPVWNNN